MPLFHTEHLFPNSEPPRPPVISLGFLLQVRGVPPTPSLSKAEVKQFWVFLGFVWSPCRSPRVWLAVASLVPGRNLPLPSSPCAWHTSRVKAHLPAIQKGEAASLRGQPPGALPFHLSRGPCKVCGSVCPEPDGAREQDAEQSFKR